MRPAIDEIRNGRAVESAPKQRLRQAHEEFRVGVANDPTNATPYLNLGKSLLDLQHFADALTCFEEAAKLAPWDAEAQLNLGRARLRTGDLAGALQCFDACVSSGQETGTVQNLRGNTLDQMGLVAESIAAYERAVSLDARSASARCNLGLAYKKAGLVTRAMMCWEEAIAEIPLSVDARVALALARMEQRQLSEAETLLRQALALDARCATALINLGLVLQRTERLDEAAACYRNALRIDASKATALVNLGSVYHRLGLSLHARKQFEAAMRIAPDMYVAQYNLAQILLLRGEFDRGWRLYEARMPWLKGCGAPPLSYSAPRWHGEDPAGRTILLVAEQGLGDTMQFIRYAPLLASRGATVLVEAQPEVCELLRSVHGISQVFCRGEQLPAFDTYCPLMSLPMEFATKLDCIPSQVPYLRADRARVSYWRERLGPENRMRVGLCWAGNPRRFDLALELTDRRRSMPLSTLSPLFEIPDVRFYSLQKDLPTDPTNDDLEVFSKLIPYPPELRTFADTAAYVENLDLVISVDTSVAHLAGGLAKPVWVLSRLDGCWRWMLHRDDSPWYPTARVWRQRAPGDWASVITAVRNALQHLKP